MKSLLNLSSDIWLVGIVPYVRVDDLVRLDSAVNNHFYRNTLHRNIRSANLSEFNLDEHHQKAVSWLVSHNVLPTCVIFEERLHQSYEEMMEVFFSRASELHIKPQFRAPETSLHDIIAACSNSAKTIFIGNSTVHSLGNLAICRKLSSLHLIGCGEIDEHELLESLRGCSIQEFVVHDPSQLLEQFFSEIFTLLPSLTSLDVKLVRNWDTILVNSVRQTNLRKFWCVGGTIGSIAVSAIARHMPHMEVLVLRASVDEATRVQETDIDFLVRSCPHVTELALMHITSVGDVAAASIASYLPSLRSLTLALCRVSDIGLSAIARCCPQLRSISLLIDFRITDAGIHAIGQHCAHLEHLGVPVDIHLTDRAFDTLNVAALRSVDVTCTSLTGTFVQTLLSEGSGVTKLVWNRCSSNNLSNFVHSIPLGNSLHDLSLGDAKLTQPEWIELSHRLSRLRGLNLSGCRAVDGDVVRSFIENNPQMLTFTLRRCSGVPRELFQEFACLRDLGDSEEVCIGLY